MSLNPFKLLGGKKNSAALVIHDDRLEVLQVKGGSGKRELVSVNKEMLEPGIVERGNILNESLFQEALQNLFKNAEPKPVKTKSLYINIPFEQIYPFVKVFSKHSKEEYMQKAILDVIHEQAPFTSDELVCEFKQKKEEGGKINFSATAYTKNWKSTVREACKEIGIDELHFHSEPIAQLGLSKLYIAGCFAMLSWHHGSIYVSLFYDDLLYDCFLLADADAAENPEKINEELKKAFDEFKQEFGKLLKELYMVRISPALKSAIKRALKSDKVEVAALEENDTHIASLISPNEYSASLIGLAMRILHDNK